jgi:hypothetical protein
MTARRESFQRVRMLTLVLVHVSMPFGCPSLPWSWEGWVF